MAIGCHHAQPILQKAEAPRPLAPASAFRIIANVYYVGASFSSSFLIKTSQGSILLDGGFSQDAPKIMANIATLGFRIEDVRILLNSHEHDDHAGALAELKRHSGAHLAVSAAAQPVLEAGIVKLLPAVRVDRVVNDGETVELGGVILTAHLTPGHTRGCTTWTMPVIERGKLYQVMFYCGTTAARLIDSTYPERIADYGSTFAKLRTLKADVFLAPHPSVFRLDEKRRKIGAESRNPFIDPTELSAYITKSEQEFRRALVQTVTETTRSPKSANKGIAP